MVEPIIRVCRDLEHVTKDSKMTPIEYGASRLALLIRQLGWETIEECTVYLQDEGLERHEATQAIQQCAMRHDINADRDTYRGWMLVAA